ncbi:Putative major facilitator, sugar transporter, major facilitator superfamily [Colletotrichum destructivum]|uniref:Major facilitator, sugar transporter, major facilitator superfamily n=1 Tax=Colletotrichum destructivum TaxID=34406 RepID=A0AAX4IX98_9PEZI|nr:Putative major facilitator, sugar transporter, major facilitator superfamily [Colletotrichum destructivum]
MPLPKADTESPPIEEAYTGPRSSGSVGTADKGARASTAALLRNPLVGLTPDELIAEADSFTELKGLQEHQEIFRKGAMVAQVINKPDGFESITALDDEEKAVLRKEVTHRWSQPKSLYFLCALCAGSAIVQGMDQTAVNGAQEFYYNTFNIQDDAAMQGLINGAPYLCSALIGCWSSPLLNKYTGRRGTIFISCFFSVVTGFWMAAADTWYNLLIARFVLGFAVGAKSSTTPVYSAESTPKTIRGALTMMWQMWTAFGIALGFIVSVAFRDTDFLGENTQWRWMLASTSIPPLVVMVQVYFCPESPRWYMEKGKYQKAFQSNLRLRNHPIQAARDMFYAYKLLEIEAQAQSGRNWKDFFTVRRNRRAAMASYFVMFMQQFCGINAMMYYSTAIFTASGFEKSTALLVSMGMGLINWIFALPAFYTIDTFGRRNLLLVTFPLMSICLFFTGFSFYIPEGTARLACIVTGIYLFAAVYSPGAGPVPFTYSAEAFPLHIRDIGMSSATAVLWGFNFIISFTWPSLIKSWGETGAFMWYACWNIFGFVVAYFWLPETKNLTLEELDSVFSVRSKDHAEYYTSKLPWYANKYLLRRDVEPFPALYELAEDHHHHTDGAHKTSVHHNEAGPLSGVSGEKQT